MTTIRTADGSTEMLLAVQWIAADMGTEIRSRQLGDELRRYVGRRGPRKSPSGRRRAYK